MDQITAADFTPPRANPAGGPALRKPEKLVHELHEILAQAKTELAKAQVDHAAALSRASIFSQEVSAMAQELVNIDAELADLAAGFAAGTVDESVLDEKHARAEHIKLCMKRREDAVKSLSREIAGQEKEVARLQPKVKSAESDIYAALLWERLPKYANAFAEFSSLYAASLRGPVSLGTIIQTANLGAILVDVCPPLRDPRRLIDISAQAFKQALPRE